MRALAGVAALLATMVAAGVALCQEQPRFQLGFKLLADQISWFVGEPLEEEHHDPVSGDGLQLTTNGRMVWRKADNWTGFISEYRVWVNGPYGVQNRGRTEAEFDWELQAWRAAWPARVYTPCPTPTAMPPGAVAVPTATAVPASWTSCTPGSTWVSPTPLPSERGTLISSRKLVLREGDGKIGLSMGGGTAGATSGWIVDLGDFPELTPGRRLVMSRDRLVCREGEGQCFVAGILYQRFTVIDPLYCRPLAGYNDMYFGFGGTCTSSTVNLRRAGNPSGWRAETGEGYFAFFGTPPSGLPAAIPPSPGSPRYRAPIELELTVDIYES